jgi:hypothetical protein
MSSDDQAGREPELRTAEQRELFRLCGERILRDHERRVRNFAPEVLADARRWAGYAPLPHALSNGDQLPPALRGCALEVF